LVEHAASDKPQTHALLALMLLQASHLPARVDAEGNLLLSEQGSLLWDLRLIQLGFHHLDKAARGEVLTEYHLQAGIASCHAMAPSYAQTDWPCILSYYDDLLVLNHSPIFMCKRASLKMRRTTTGRRWLWWAPNRSGDSCGKNSTNAAQNRAQLLEIDTVLPVAQPAKAGVRR
jgi:predicted RNA polymerase sigma factor